MDRAHIALLDPADEAARRRAEDEQIIASRFCRASVGVWRGCRAQVTWAPDGLSYTCEHGNEQLARYCGFSAAADEAAGSDEDEIEIEAIWLGTVRTARGTFAAQFEIRSSA